MGTRIRGILAVVPPRIRTFEELAAHFGHADTRRIVDLTGVEKVHLNSPGQTTTDLAEEAGRRLLSRVGVAPQDIDGVIFVTQTPDYLLPASACMLQARLGIPKRSLAFDINQGCAGYPYGLAISGGLLAGGFARRVLLLNGDIIPTHPDDKATVPLFGVAATATLLENDAETDLLGMDLGTDGSGWANLIVPVGQARYPTLDGFSANAPENLRSIPHPEYVYMNGSEIFTFTLREVPGILKRTLESAGRTTEDVDYFFFHQANKFILDHLTKRMKLRPEKCPMSIGQYGNTSGASPALTACHAVADINCNRDLTAMFVGFGVGYAWGGALVHLRAGTICPIETIG